MEHKSSKETSTSTTFPNNNDVDSDSLHLHGEIELLKNQIQVKDEHINKLETSVFSGNHLSKGEISYLKDEINNMDDKYERLCDAHRRIQKVNQNLEDKLLKIADRFESERCALVAEISKLQRKVLDAKVTISELQEENERYKNDCNIAVQLLQCKPSNFMSHRLEHVPANIQERLKSTYSEKTTCDAQPEPEQPEKIAMPIATFPPTAMVFSVNKRPHQQQQSCSANGSATTLGAGTTSTSEGSGDMITSAAIARVLQPKRSCATHRTRMYLCKACKTDVDVCERGTQTSSRIFRPMFGRDLPQTHTSASGSALARSDSGTSSGSRESEV